MSMEEVEDFASVAQEWGGRIGFLSKEELGGNLTPVIVRCSVTEGGLAYEIIVPDEGKMVLLLRNDDHEWVLNNPVPDGDDDDD
jgi:hypothetical protein